MSCIDIGRTRREEAIDLVLFSPVDRLPINQAWREGWILHCRSPFHSIVATGGLRVQSLRFSPLSRLVVIVLVDNGGKIHCIYTSGHLFVTCLLAGADEWLIDSCTKHPMQQNSPLPPSPPKPLFNRQSQPNRYNRTTKMAAFFQIVHPPDWSIHIEALLCCVE